ncbi:hypothetical protein R1sor_023497 [Riccia sorocarpa]|uniref:Uncharacterized protein n=1 Tax=Riccia sorocarpa TaxID=122646 RepID=A0ABD3GPD2_9MARC
MVAGRRALWCTGGTEGCREAGRMSTIVDEPVLPCTGSDEAAPSPGYAPQATPSYVLVGPSPTYAPAPTPGYAPTPTLGYDPTLTPEYAPVPTPGYAPEPTPGTDPTPTPGYAPAPTPGYEPARTPADDPVHYGHHYRGRNELSPMTPAQGYVEIETPSNAWDVIGMGGSQLIGIPAEIVDVPASPEYNRRWRM